jgi:23S rRNA (uracil1939-C5)-methyltransferase
MAGSDHMMMEIGEKRFQVSAGSFFQVNAGVARLMVDHILNNLSLSGDETLLDIYCGVGLVQRFPGASCYPSDWRGVITLRLR